MAASVVVVDQVATLAVAANQDLLQPCHSTVVVLLAVLVSAPYSRFLVKKAIRLCAQNGLSSPISTKQVCSATRDCVTGTLQTGASKIRDSSQLALQATCCCAKMPSPQSTQLAALLHQRLVMQFYFHW